MQRRFVLLLVIVVIAALAAWLSNAGRRAERAEEGEPPAAESVHTAAPATLVAPEIVPPPATAATEPSREDVAPAPAERSSAPAPSAAMATLVVRVMAKQTGTPLARVRVWAMPDGPGRHSASGVDGTKGTLETTPITGDEGVVEVELPPGIDLHVLATGEDEDVGGANRHVAALEAGERREIVFELATGADLHYFGRVLAREDGRPVAARIEVTRYRMSFTTVGSAPTKRKSSGTVLDDTTTDADGLFELWLSSWKEANLLVQALEFAPLLVQFGPGHETPETAKEILLSRSATLQARILDASGAAVLDASVRLWTECYHLGESDSGGLYFPSLDGCEWSGAADTSGTCRVGGLPPEVPLHVEIRRGGKVAKEGLPDLSFHPGEVRELEWRLGSGCLLTGTAVDQDGDPVANRTLWLQRADAATPRFFEKYHSGDVVREARTDSDARFAFNDVEPGSWWLGPAAERDDGEAADPDALAAIGEVVEIPEGVPSRELVLRVHRGLYIRGSVLTPTGEPAPGAYVFGGNEAASWGLQARTGDDGTFALGPLLPGRYTLTANGSKDADSESVQANFGDEGVVLRLRAGGSLAGRVVDGATGDGCAGRITCAAADRADVGWLGTECDEEGFHFEGLPPGIYNLAASSSGNRAGALRGVMVRAGQETSGLVVTLAPGALVRIRYAGTAGYLSYCVNGDGVTMAGEGIAAGGTSEAVVPAGKVVIRYWVQAVEQEKLELQLAVGEERTIELGGPR